MYIYKQHHYHVYIVTNPEKTVLYTGVTNNLAQRLTEHWENRRNPKTFAGKYYCYNLIYYEYFPYIKNAIIREKEIKGWRRQKKTDLIKTLNPNWVFMNVEVCNKWSPKKIIKRE
jgi:putative endonuclease